MLFTTFNPNSVTFDHACKVAGTFMALDLYFIGKYLRSLFLMESL